VELVYLEPAKRDLERIRSFFLAQKVGEETASTIIASIVADANCLKDHPKLGFAIGEKYGYKSAYRGLLVCKERYLIAYEITETAIEVRRIYSTRESYIKDLTP